MLLSEIASNAAAIEFMQNDILHHTQVCFQNSMVFYSCVHGLHKPELDQLIYMKEQLSIQQEKRRAMVEAKNHFELLKQSNIIRLA